MPKPPDLLDWTFANIPESSPPAPGSPQLPPAPRTPSPARPVPWQAWAGLGLMVGLVWLGQTLYQTWESYRVRQELTTFLNAQEQSRQARDSVAHEQFLDPTAPANWRAQQTNRILGNVPYLPTLPGFSPTFAPPQVVQMTPITATLWRVAQAYTFYTLDGSPVTFVYTNFYRYTQQHWWHTPPPPDWQNPPAAVWQGRYVELHYPAPDAALITTLGPELDAILQQACAHWACPANLKLVRHFSLEPDVTPYPQQYAPRDESFILTLRQSPFSAASDFVSPSLYGYPADAVSHAWYRRALAAVLLDDLARELTQNTRNAFVHALAIREGVRLGVEPASLLDLTVATDLFTPDDLWDAGLFGWPGYSAPQQALALLNVVLKDQPAEVDYQLLRALKPPGITPNTTAWLATALKVSAAEAANLLAASTTLPTLPLLNATPNELVLQCPIGLQMGAAATATSLTPLLPTPFAHLGTRPLQWSPDGQQLAVLAAGRPALLNFASGQVTWLPGHFFPDSTEVQWISPTALAYTSYVDTSLRQSPNQHWLFWDVNQALTLPLQLRGVAQYLPAPNGQRALVLKYPETAQPNLLAYLMPALGERPLNLGVGQLAQWARTSDALWLLRYLAAEQAYVVDQIDPTTGMATERLRLPQRWSVEESLGTFAAAPNGQWFALAFNHYAAATTLQIWLFDETGRFHQEFTLAHTVGEQLQFSADGAYLALQVWGEKGTARTWLYEFATGHTQLLDYANLGWSPTGHQLLLGDPRGVALLANFNDPPTRLAWGCQSGLWRP